MRESDKRLNEAYIQVISEKKVKSPACEYVLQQMDTEDGADNYKQFVKEALKKFPKANKADLEKELAKYI